MLAGKISLVLAAIAQYIIGPNPLIFNSDLNFSEEKRKGNDKMKGRGKSPS